MALIGGGLLFTHVHTVAPYANVAAGVYIAHVVMGSMALGIGVARLAEEAAPAGSAPSQLLFVSLLCLEAVLLVTYNEGLPWYIGYGDTSAGGPSPTARATSARPSPPTDQSALSSISTRGRQPGRLVKDRFSERPVAHPRPADRAAGSRGYERLASGSRPTAPGPGSRGRLRFSRRDDLLGAGRAAGQRRR